ncbi:pectinesterase/pectinesterase inhibitor 23-related [Anaeramoeba flamelloides]|uniref:Pectinesterase/pectinesterase inhibitor 23-related n=1 Tax=Anaeramoeba flamelloides TaxID=1746091 RepID=A0AAV7YM36_9EUKA|nr:pectinesterase/pectinesterase inhibitor 23-related [Anaeramoeba flamelloides]
MKANSSKIYLVLIFISCVLCEVWVSNNGSDTNGDGSYNSPYKTLAHTFDVINDNGAIHLKSGVFIESIETNKMVSLSGEGVNNTTIKGGITFNCASSSTFQNHYLTNLTFEGTSFFIRFTNGVTFQNVSWKGIKFQLNGNLNDSNALIRFEKMTTVKDFKITNCTFSTGSYSNPYGAVFAFYFDGGKIVLDDLLIEGYDYQSNFTSQFLLFGNPTEVLLKNSKTLQGGNFYISDSTDVKVHKNVFTNSPLGINNCQNVELYQNIFNNSGDNLVYSSIVDKLEHS